MAMKVSSRLVGRRRAITIEVFKWRITARRATLDWKRWTLIRDGRRAFAVYLPFVVVTMFERHS
jgi:hypothetical protein